MYILENIKERLHNYKPELDKTNLENSKLLTRISKSEKEIVNLKEEILQKNADINSMRQEIEKKQTKISGLETVLEISTKKRMALLQNRNSLAGKVGSISKKLKKFQEEKEQLQKTIIGLNEELKKEKNKPTIAELALYQQTGKRKVGTKNERSRDSRKVR